jgi:hypothetical protein
LLSLSSAVSISIFSQSFPQSSATKVQMAHYPSSPPATRELWIRPQRVSFRDLMMPVEAVVP